MCSELEAFEQKFRITDLHVASVGTWRISVRPAQVTLGSMIVSLAADVSSLATMNEAEAADLGRALSLTDRLARSAFGAVRTNALCLMMQDPIVHFHILPRYPEAQYAFGQNWIDREWPRPPQLQSEPITDEVLAAIRDRLFDAVQAMGG
jgi:diadenosine tetraphosphate (Ap4A) HIT family hydrolase